jgi:hypothetical protein
MGDPSGSPVSRTADTLSTPTRPSRTARPRGTSRAHNGTGATVSRPVAVALDIAGDRINGCALGRTTSDSWKHAYLPVEHPVTVESHDRITLAPGGGAAHPSIDTLMTASGQCACLAQRVPSTLSRAGALTLVAGLSPVCSTGPSFSPSNATRHRGRGRRTLVGGGTPCTGNASPIEHRVRQVAVRAAPRPTFALT